MNEHEENGALSNQAEGFYHVPVLLDESIEALNIDPSGTYIDCTFGGGGHAREILKRLNSEGKLYAFDQDEDAKANIPADSRLVFIPHNFRNLSRFLRLHGVDQVNGILADLGVSSHQFDVPSRGFSIRFDAPLDMRMDRSQDKTAADILKEMSADQLQYIFQEYGEISNSKTLALLLESKAKTNPIKTINELKAAVSNIVKGNPNRYFAQLFQALRMAVNDEITALIEMLEQSAVLLKPGGRIAVITFHSIEDRVVKNYFKNGIIDHAAIDHIYGIKKTMPFSLLNKKPIEPGEKEIKNNPRSRSARLRVAVKN
jgi:16S rRNA (cytosine1402-N4)-methyltransferase